MATTTPETSSLNVKSRNAARRFFGNENAVLVIVLLAVIGAMAIATKGLVLGVANVVNVLTQGCVTGVASIGQAFVIMTAGVDLSVGGIGLFTSILGGAMMTAALDQNIIGHVLSPYIALPVMVLVGGAWGALNGSLVSRVGMPALIVTLGMLNITKGAAFQISQGNFYMQLPDSLSFIGSGSIGGVPVLVGIFVAVAVVGYFILQHTIFGRSVYAVGSNPVSAWLCGINVRRTLLFVYMISGILAGLAGVMLTARAMSSSMQAFGGLELNTIAAVCVGGVSLAGGRGNIVGVVLGVLLIGVINNGLSVLGATVTAQGITIGAIIITAVGIDYRRRR